MDELMSAEKLIHELANIDGGCSYVFEVEGERMIKEYIRAILEAAAERVDRLCETMDVDYNSIEQAKNAILEPITKEKS